MGSSLSPQQSKYVDDLYYLVTENGHSATKKEVEALVWTIGDMCPWVPESGTFDLEKWTKIGMNFQGNPKVSSRILFTWCKVRACLKGLTPNNILFSQQLASGNSSYPPLPQILPPQPLNLMPSAPPPPNYNQGRLPPKPPDKLLRDDEDSSPDLFPTDEHNKAVLIKPSASGSTPHGHTTMLSRSLAAALCEAGATDNSILSAFPVIRGRPAVPAIPGADDNDPGVAGRPPVPDRYEPQKDPPRKSPTYQEAMNVSGNQPPEMKAEAVSKKPDSKNDVPLENLETSYISIACDLVKETKDFDECASPAFTDYSKMMIPEFVPHPVPEYTEHTEKASLPSGNSDTVRSQPEFGSGEKEEEAVQEKPLEATAKIAPKGVQEEVSPSLSKPYLESFQPPLEPSKNEPTSWFLDAEAADLPKKEKIPQLQMENTYADDVSVSTELKKVDKMVVSIESSPETEDLPTVPYQAAKVVAGATEKVTLGNSKVREPGDSVVKAEERQSPYQALAQIADLFYKACTRCCQLSGLDIQSVYSSFPQGDVVRLLQTCSTFQVAFADFVGTVLPIPPKDKRLTFFSTVSYSLTTCFSPQPLVGKRMLFTNGSPQQRVVVWQDSEGHWMSRFTKRQTSAQRSELAAVLEFDLFRYEDFNLVVDTQYVYLCLFPDPGGQVLLVELFHLWVL